MRGYFHRLDKDVLDEIFAFHHPYKHLFTSILNDRFENDKVKALRQFLRCHIRFDETNGLPIHFNEWTSMSTLSFLSTMFYRVHIPHHTLFVHVMSLDERQMHAQTMHMIQRTQCGDDLAILESIFRPFVQKRLGQAYDDDRMACTYVRSNGRIYMVAWYDQIFFYQL